jgi:hypothetical protein
MKIEDTLEDFTTPFKPTSPPGTIKRRAAQYLGKIIGQSLTKQEVKQVEAKAKKIKKSTIKADRQCSHQLVKQVELIKDIDNASSN